MNFEKIACVGSGTIGKSWAALFSLNGFCITLYDLEEKILEEALEEIESQLLFLSDKELVDEEAVEDSLGKIKKTTRLSEALADVDYVQESAPEDAEVKKKLFGKIDQMTPKETIIASSTSGLLMTTIQGATKNPSRCVIAHPYNPPLLMPLVEIVPGDETSEETLEDTYDLMKEIGKKPVRLKKEVPGFIGNRLQGALYREVCSLIERDVANVEEIDKAMKYGPALRWAFMGANLTYYFGGGQNMKHFFNQFRESFKMLWNEMDDLKSIPESVENKIIEETEELDIVKEKDRTELRKWRDEKLIDLLKSVTEDFNYSP